MFLAITEQGVDGAFFLYHPGLVQTNVLEMVAIRRGDTGDWVTVASPSRAAPRSNV